MRTRITPNTDTFYVVLGSIKCGKVCINVSEMNTFTSDFTSGTYNINHKRGCEDNCLACLLLCEYCGKQYVGGNTNKLRYRWNN